MVTGQLYSGIRVPSIRYRKDRSVWPFVVARSRGRCPEMALHRVAFQSPLGSEGEGRIPRVHVWYLQMAEQYRTIDSYSGRVHARFFEETSWLRLLPRFPPAARAVASPARPTSRRKIADTMPPLPGR